MAPPETKGAPGHQGEECRRKEGVPPEAKALVRKRQGSNPSALGEHQVWLTLHESPPVSTTRKRGDLAILATEGAIARRRVGGVRGGAGKPSDRPPGLTGRNDAFRRPFLRRVGGVDGEAPQFKECNLAHIAYVFSKLISCTSADLLGLLAEVGSYLIPLFPGTSLPLTHDDTCLFVRRTPLFSGNSAIVSIVSLPGKKICEMVN